VVCPSWQWSPTAAAVVLVVVVTAGAGLGVLAVLPPMFLVVASRGLVSSNATVLGVERGSRSAGSASAVLGACMFGGGVLVTPLVGLGPEGSPIPMALVVAGGAIAAMLATMLLTRSAVADPALASGQPSAR
jgi:DHA1 family bicyclomycin/chloramphenicol resistance-like MFS transporter